MSDDKPDECMCCYYETELKLYSQSHGGADCIRDLWLCELCANSLAGTLARYPLNYPPGTLMLGGLIMNAANHILAELKRVKP